MADKKISQLPAAATPLAGTEVLPLVQGGITEQVSVANLTAGRDVTMENAAVGGAISGSYKLAVYGAITSTLGANYFAGTLGIGTTPAYALDVARGGGAQLLLRVGQSGVSNGYTIISDGTNLTYQFDDGNVKIGTAGKGIDFSANGGDVLTQYDEGTWTPTITAYSGTITTVGAVVGTYTRVGRLVTLSGSFAITTNGTGSVLLQITNLPFAATSGTPANFTGTGICPTTGKQLVLQYNVVAAKIYVSYYDGTYPGADASNYAFSITYEIS